MRSALALLSCISLSSPAMAGEVLSGNGFPITNGWGQTVYNQNAADCDNGSSAFCDDELLSPPPVRPTDINLIYLSPTENECSKANSQSGFCRDDDNERPSPVVTTGIKVVIDPGHRHDDDDDDDDGGGNPGGDDGSVGGARDDGGDNDDDDGDDDD